MSGLCIGPQLMDGLSAGRSPPRRKRKVRKGDKFLPALCRRLFEYKDSPQHFLAVTFSHENTIIFKGERSTG